MLNSKGFSAKQFISNEKPKIRVDSNDATESKQPRKGFQAHYNNLIESNPEQQAALQQLRKSVLNRAKQST